MNIIAVTNRTLCQDDAEFFHRLETLAALLREGDTILLREKSISLINYLALSTHCREICKNSRATLRLHTYPEAARLLEIPQLHLPLHLLHNETTLGLHCSTSVHSVEEAVQAESLGAEFVIAGHIFPTDCKKGLEPRGLDFLKEVCSAVKIPVFGIGGITAERAPQVIEAGAAGVCVMSEFMTCDDLPTAIAAFQK